MPNTEVKLLSADCSEGFPFVRAGRRHAKRIRNVPNSFFFDLKFNPLFFYFILDELFSVDAVDFK